MLLEALDHPKTLDLAARLGVELPTAIGYLELLWAFTAKKAPAGNVGKWPAGAIARACYYMGDPATFVAALTGARFLDDDPGLGLCVHDWQDHAPRWVKAKLKQSRQSFVVSAVRAAGSTTVATIVPTGSPTHRVEKGSQAKPRVGKESAPPDLATVVATTVAADPDPFDVLEGIRFHYPGGTFGAQNWILAEREVGKLLDAGETADALQDGARTYRAQQDAMGNTGTQYIRSPEKFYRDGFWRGPFPMPVERARPGAGKSFAEAHARLSTPDDEGAKQ